MQNQKLKWNNLKRNKCPKCNTDLGFNGLLDDVLACKNERCDFAITEQKFQSIVMRMNKEALDLSTYNDNEETEDLKKVQED